jgi:hypothetical protein
MSNLCKCECRKKLYELNEELDNTEICIMELMRGGTIENYQDAASLIEERENLRSRLHDLHNIIYK